MKNLTAIYYKEDGQIVIYNSHSKLVEFPVDDRSAWGLPPLSEWIKTDTGCEIEFRYVVDDALKSNGESEIDDLLSKHLWGCRVGWGTPEQQSDIVYQELWCDCGILKAREEYAKVKALFITEQSQPKEKDEK